MWRRLRQALPVCYGWMRQRISWLREVLGMRAVNKQRAAGDNHQKTARARFWADFRAGQREAETHCSKRDP